MVSPQGADRNQKSQGPTRSILGVQVSDIPGVDPWGRWVGPGWVTRDQECFEKKTKTPSQPQRPEKSSGKSGSSCTVDEQIVVGDLPRPLAVATVNPTKKWTHQSHDLSFTYSCLHQSVSDRSCQ